MSYTINFSLTDANVVQINTTLAQQITVVKSIPNKSTANNIAWLSFPAANSISVVWDEVYRIYASTQAIQNGAVISSSSNTGANTQLGSLYDLSGGVFTNKGPGTQGAYEATNNSGKNMTFGLAQAATVAGTAVFAPISADMLGNTQDIQLVPRVQLSVFLSTTTDNGTVISKIAGNAYTFSVSTSTPTASLIFDQASNTFVQSPNPMIEAEIVMERLRLSKPREAVPA